MHTSRPARSLAVLGAVSAAAAVLTACGSMSMTPAFNQSSLPPTIQVPAGNKVAMETVGKGDIKYECRDKANAPGQTEWVFVDVASGRPKSVPGEIVALFGVG